MVTTETPQQEGHPPSEAVVQGAHIQDWDKLAREADEDFVGFWGARAKELVGWHEPWTKVLDESSKPFLKWIVGTRTDIVHNAIDRHLTTHRRNKLALICGRERRPAARARSWAASQEPDISTLEE